MKKCNCKIRIENGEDKDKVFKVCLCSRGCMYCAERNLYRADWVYKKEYIKK
jgi:hypothetical protein